MHGDVPVSLLVPVVLGHVVQVISPHHDGSLHFCGNDDALQNLAPDGHVGSEWALFVDILALTGLLGGLES